MSAPSILHDVLYYVGVAETSYLLYVLPLAALALAFVPRMGMQRSARFNVVGSAAIGVAGAFIVDSQYGNYREALRNYNFGYVDSRPELSLFTTVLAGVVVAACVATWVFFTKTMRQRRSGVRFLTYLAGLTITSASLSVFAYMVDVQVIRDFWMFGTVTDLVLVGIFIYARDFAFVMATIFVLAGVMVAIRAYGRRQFRKGVESVTPRTTPDMSRACEAGDAQPVLIKDSEVQVATVPPSQWSAHAQG